MKYSANKNIVIFDYVYPIKTIEFNETVSKLEYSFDNETYYDLSFTKDGNVFIFEDQHMRYLKCDNEVTVKNVSMGKGYIIDELDELDNSFIKYRGWSGADGVFTYKIGDNIYWYFSDTFIGEVNRYTYNRLPGYIMLNNTYGISKVNDPYKVDCLYNKDKLGNPVNLFDAPFGYYWLQDSYIYDGYLNLMPIIVQSEHLNDGMFTVDGVDLIKVPIEGNKLLFDQYETFRTPLYFKDKYDSKIYFGASFLDVGDYVYNYGWKHSKYDKTMVVCRVKRELFYDFSQYEFLDKNQTWNKDNSELFELSPDCSSDFMVFEEDDKFVNIFTPTGGVGEKICIEYSDSPDGPFENQRHIYSNPIVNQFDYLISYNAKIQKVLSTKDEYIVSYHVNASGKNIHDDARIYRPRFIKLIRVGD